LRTVRLHFGNSPDGSALLPDRRGERQAELRLIFREVAGKHPDAAFVRGCSWLYHVPAYSSLFPETFIDGLESVGYLHQFAALWGQFLDRYGSVKRSLQEAFLAKVEVARTLHDLNAAFPVDVLATTCPIAVFYREFDVS
jgi:hypothetical protein